MVGTETGGPPKRGRGRQGHHPPRMAHGGGWAHRPRVAPRRSPALGRPQIVDAAVALADAEGLEAVSMRRIAQRLGAGAMSLYRHVASKDELLELMVDAAFALHHPDRPSGDWQSDLRVIAHEIRAVVHRHPWLVLVFGARHRPGPNFLRHVEFSLAAVSGIDPDFAVAVAIQGTVDDYVFGFTMRELAEAEATRRSGLTEEESWMAVLPQMQTLLATGQYPIIESFSRPGADISQLSADDRFALGLDALLTGLAAHLAARHQGVSQGQPVTPASEAPNLKAG